MLFFFIKDEKLNFTILMKNRNILFSDQNNNDEKKTKNNLKQNIVAMHVGNNQDTVRLLTKSVFVKLLQKYTSWFWSHNCHKLLPNHMLDGTIFVVSR